MFTSFASEYKTTSIKTCKGKPCPECGTKQNSNVVKICKNKKCQHVFSFKCKKEKDGRGCTTKKCPECGEHALSNGSDDCSDPKCGYKFPSGLKKKKKKNDKNGKRKRKNRSSDSASQKKKKPMLAVQTAANEPQVENTPNSGLLFQMNPFSLLADFSGPTELTRSNSLTLNELPIESFGIPPLNERQSSLELIGTPLNERNSSLELFGTPPLNELTIDWSFETPPLNERNYSDRHTAKAMPKPFEPDAFDYSDQELPDYEYNSIMNPSDYLTFYESSNEITNTGTPTKMQHLTSLDSNMCDSDPCIILGTRDGNMHEDLRNML